MSGSLFILKINDSKFVKDENGIKIFGVRIPKFLPDGWIHLPNTGPPKELLYQAKNFEKEGSWNYETFKKFYVPNYLSYIKNQKSNNEFLEIKNYLDNDYNVFYACYCKDEHICHRSIVKRIFEIKGYDTQSI